MITSISSRLFALRVLPVCTKSTIMSESPTKGANSTEPFKTIMSDEIPLDRKKDSARLGNFVATRGLVSSLKGRLGRSLGAATESLQYPNGSINGSYRSSWLSRKTSSPAIPMSAAPWAT